MPADPRLPAPMDAVLVVTGAVMQGHVGGIDEVPARLDAVWAGIDRARRRGVPVVVRPSEAVSREDALRIHPSDYLDAFAQACADGRPCFGDRDCPLSPGTHAAALHAAGACAQAARALVTGEHQRAFCAVRPPGHHAHAARARGFCFLNNAAIAAHILAEAHGRVLILDVDNHHGDGTEAILAAQPAWAYASLHGDPRRCYPGTGHASPAPRRWNAPLPVHADGATWLAALDDILDAAVGFAPGALVVSFGTDALQQDPLSDLRLRLADLREGCRRIRDRFPLLPWLSVLEGGYALGALALAVEDHLEVLAGR